MQTMKRSLSLFMVLAMLIALVPALSLGASAANVNYVYASNGKYIYNWGTRGTTATFLSPNAEDFYEDNNTSYAELSSYSGGTGKSDAPKSDLYRELKELMTSNHSYITSYAATRDLYQYTDCQNGGGKISSFYSGTAIGPAWGEGSWNREHTWPNSKGLGGNDENDLMMLRPTSTSENSSRGNTAYGQSSGYYNPNKESGGKYDLRGDVARIFLYVYVRWGNTSYAWGSSGVMESLEVLLEWMEADPVDTWELGRNDSVESITGTRNVFVDYPELAFILFGAEIPADMTTPSGEAGNKCDHNNFGAGVVTVATCTEKGYTLYTCQVAGCGYSYKDNIVEAKGHNYVSDVCSVCGDVKAAPVEKPSYVSTFEVGKAYKLGLFSSALGAEYYFNGTMKGYYGATDTAYTNGIDVYVENATGGYRLYFKDESGAKQYINLVASGTYRNFTFATSATSVYTWDAAKSTFKTTVEGEVCYIGTYGSYYTMGVLQTSKLNDSDYYARLYTMGSSEGGNTPSTPEETTPPADNPTTPPVAGEATISFKDTTTRTSFSKTQQIWMQNGITVTNDKASASSDVADYANPARFYQGSNVTISYPNMTKIVIDCSGLDAKYVDSWLNVPSNATATKNNNIITVVFDSPVDSITYTGLAKQSRAYSITVYAEVASQPEETTPEVTTPEETTPEETTPEETTPEETTPEETTPEGEINYGTLNSPVTVTYAYNACANLANGESSANAFYVRGTVTAIGTTGSYYKNVYISDGTTELLIYTINMSDGIGGFEVGDTIVACGYIKNYNDIIEMATYNGSVYVYVVKVEAGTPDQGDVTTPEETTPEQTTPEVTPPEDTPELEQCKHTNTTVEGAKEATCATEGNTGSTVCADCGVVLTEGKEIAKTEHVMADWVQIRVATCTTEGLERSDCDNCTYYETKTSAALGHNDADKDGVCDTCNEEIVLPPEQPENSENSNSQDHVCKEVTPFQAFINAIINFFRRLLGQPELCACGETILVKEEQ